MVSGVRASKVRSCEIEVPPAKARWRPVYAQVKFVAAKLKYHRLKRGGVYYFTNSRDVRTLGVYVHCIQRLAGSDEKSIAFWTAKTNVARGFR